MLKRLIILSICCYITANSYSQNYVAEYNSDAMGKASLLFNSSKWRYDVTNEGTMEYSSQETNVQNVLPPSTSKTINLFYFRSLDTNYYLDEEGLPDFSLQTKCVIKGKLIKPDWTIVSDSVKTIEDYSCIMAKGHVCGRDYTVWFTPDIAVSAGPWKLWGLPGLIVEAQSDDQVLNFYMTSLKNTDERLTDPKVKSTITREEYKTRFNDALNKIERRLRSGGTTDVDVKISVRDLPDKTLLE